MPHCFDKRRDLRRRSSMNDSSGSVSSPAQPGISSRSSPVLSGIRYSSFLMTEYISRKFYGRQPIVSSDLVSLVSVVSISFPSGSKRHQRQGFRYSENRYPHTFYCVITVNLPFLDTYPFGPQVRLNTDKPSAQVMWSPSTCTRFVP